MKHRQGRRKEINKGHRDGVNQIGLFIHLSVHQDNFHVGALSFCFGMEVTQDKHYEIVLSSPLMVYMAMRLLFVGASNSSLWEN